MEQTGNLFGVAKKVVKPTTTKGSKEYEEVILKEQDYPMISNSLVELERTRAELKSLKGESDMYNNAVLQTAKEAYVNLYRETGRNPKTFIIRGELGGCFMVQPMDKYKIVDEAKVDYLTQTYGANIISEEVEYIFNANVLNLPGNMERISKAIQESDLSDEDKMALIGQRVKRTIAKGTIDRFAEFNAEVALQDFEPIFALKNYK